MTIKAIEFCRKLLLIIVSELIGNPLGYRLIGGLNRVTGSRLGTVFLVYPAHPGYVTAVTFGAYARRALWRPRFAGVYSPAPGKWGLVMAVTALESELVDEQNASRLGAIVAELDRIRCRVGAGAVSLSGILPSVLRARGVSISGQEREQTAAVVVQAIRQTLREHGLDGQQPIILLGGAGYIGKAVTAQLQRDSANPLLVIDTRSGDSEAELLARLEPLRGRPALLVNVSRNDVLERFLPALWPQLVILNEVFPEAARTTRQQLARRGIAYLHLAGLRGLAIPRFAGPYAGAIPCCALALQSAEQAQNRLVIKRLGAA